MEKKRGQIAVEYLVISAVAVSIAVGGWYIVQDSLAKYNDQVQLDKLDTSIRQLVASAEEVAYLGEGAKKTVDVNMPERMNGMRVVEEGGQYFLEVNVSTSAGDQIQLYDLPVALRGGGECTE